MSSVILSPLPDSDQQPLKMKALSPAMSELSAGLCLYCAALLCFQIYLPAMNTPWTYDDIANLSGLGQISDLESALTFITSGTSGPLGRPLALASFVLNAPDWPVDAFPFKRVNVLIHLLNALLLTKLCLQIGQILHTRISQPAWFAVIVACIWMAHPFLASTSVMAVQRMTSLSASFCLLGLITYLHGRIQFPKAAGPGIIWMSIGVGFGTLLAVLSKENGALLPLFVAILEFTLLKPYHDISRAKLFRVWALIFLALPLITLLVYLGIQLNGHLTSYATRAFNLQERLLTENVILFDYLRNILLPGRSGLGPFHDDFAISKSLLLPITTLFSLTAWLMLTLLAWSSRKTTPVLFFSVCWFLGGHVLESTVIALELYFEHRNYMPSIGPLFAICFYLWHHPSPLKSVLRSCLAVYAGLLVFLLHETTQTWSQPVIAAQLWAQEHPLSKRAQQYLSMQYSALNDHIKATETIVTARKNIPESTGLALQVLQLECSLGRLSKQTINDITRSLHKGDLDLSSIDTLGELIKLQNEGRCPELGIADIHNIITALMTNPTYQASGTQLANLHIVSAFLYRKQGNLNSTIENLDTAVQFAPDLNTFLLSAANLLDAGLYDEASKHLHNAMAHLPNNPFIRKKWLKEINQFQKHIDNRMKKTSAVKQVAAM